MPAPASTSRQLLRLVGRFVEPSAAVQRFLARHGQDCRDAGLPVEEHLRGLLWAIDRAALAVYQALDDAAANAGD